MSMAFIDYEKAFDSVETPAVMNAVKKQGVTLKYIRMMFTAIEEETGRLNITQTFCSRS